MLEALATDDIKAIALQTDANKVITKEFLTAAGKTKLTELTSQEMQDLFQKLVE